MTQREAGLRAIEILQMMLEGDEKAMARGINQGKRLLKRLACRSTSTIPPEREHITPVLKCVGEAITEAFGYTLEKLREDNRQRDLSDARQAAMLLAREFSGEALEGIAQWLGRCDHATIMWGIKQAKHHEQTNRGFALRIARARARCAELLQAVPSQP